MTVSVELAFWSSSQRFTQIQACMTAHPTTVWDTTCLLQQLGLPATIACPSLVPPLGKSAKLTQSQPDDAQTAM